MPRSTVHRHEERESQSPPPGPIGTSPVYTFPQGPVGFCPAEAGALPLKAVTTYSEATPIAAEQWMEMAIFTRSDFIAMAKATANYTSPVLDAYSLQQVLKEMGITGRATVKTIKGKEYVVLSGYPGLRKTLTGTKYGVKNAKIVQMGIGPAGIAKSAFKGGGITIVLTVGADILEAVVNDEDLMTSKLGFTIVTDVGKAGIGAAIGYAASMLAIGATSIAAAPLAVGIVVGVGISLLLDQVYPTEEIVAKMEQTRKETARAIESAGRTWSWINSTPEGAMWFMRRFAGY